MSRIVIRPLRNRNEYLQAQEVARAAWQFDDVQLTPAADMQMVGHIGGLTAGAFENGEMLGFIHGVPRTNLDEPCMHSHQLAVIPAARGRGLAARLKFFQRRWCLDRGIKRVTWTYDPLLVRNAHLNLVRLKARAQKYLPDFYGPMGGIYGNLPTDRFEVRWRLAVEIPLDTLGLCATDPAAALRERLRFRRLATRLFAGGYAAVAIKPLPGRALYVFEWS